VLKVGGKDSGECTVRRGRDTVKKRSSVVDGERLSEREGDFGEWCKGPIFVGGKGNRTGETSQSGKGGKLRTKKTDAEKGEG